MPTLDPATSTQPYSAQEWLMVVAILERHPRATNLPLIAELLSLLRSRLEAAQTQGEIDGLGGWVFETLCAVTGRSAEEIEDMIAFQTELGHGSSEAVN